MARTDRPRVRLQQLQGLLNEVFVVLAHHAAPVLAARTSVRTFILEEDLVGRIVVAGVAFGLVEAVGIQARHVAIVEPPGNLLDPGILPRQAASVREMLFVDLLLDRRIVFRDLGGDTNRNLLPVELLGEGVDQITEFQSGADVGLGFPELPNQALDRMTARFQRPFVGRSLLAGVTSSRWRFSEMAASSASASVNSRTRAGMNFSPAIAAAQ